MLRESRENGQTEKMLAATAALFDYLHQSRLQLLNGRYMVGQNTHLAGFGWNVHLDPKKAIAISLSSRVVEARNRHWYLHIGRLIDCLCK